MQTAELKRSNAELEQFAAIASHDLQEPLRGVASCLQILEKKYKDVLDDEGNELIQYSIQEAIRMKQLIVDLLALGRISAKPKDFEPTDVTKVITEVLKNLQAAIQESGAVVTYDALPTITADESQLMQLFQNLIANAIKFCKDKPPEIHIASSHEDNHWMFSVHDNGVGFAQQHAAQIFLPFKRLHNRDKYIGSGIGLAICQRIVERHDGNIWAISELDKGATFYFAILDREKKI